MSLAPRWVALPPAPSVHLSRSIYAPPLAWAFRFATLFQFRRPQPHHLLSSAPQAPLKFSQQRRQQRRQQPFSTTPLLCKKGGKGGKPSPPPSTTQHLPTSPANPFDFTDLQTSIADALSRLRSDLAKLQRGVRIQPEAIERLPVQLKYAGSAEGGKAKGGRGGGKETETETVRVEDLATVVPKGGRMMVVMVGEESHVKPLLTALQSPPPPTSILPSSTSLTPQLDPQNPLQVTIPIPPPTHASRLALVDTAKQFRDRASQAVRNARGDTHKRLKEMLKTKEAVPDEVRKALKEMEEVVEKGNKEVKGAVEEGERRIMGG